MGRAEETRALKRLPQLENMGGGGQAEDREEHKIPLLFLLGTIEEIQPLWGGRIDVSASY